MRGIDEAFVDAEIVDPKGDFRAGAYHALKAAMIMMAHGSGRATSALSGPTPAR